MGFDHLFQGFKLDVNSKFIINPWYTASCQINMWELHICLILNCFIILSALYYLKADTKIVHKRQSMQQHLSNVASSEITRLLRQYGALCLYEMRESAAWFETWKCIQRPKYPNVTIDQSESNIPEKRGLISASQIRCKELHYP